MMCKQFLPQVVGLVLVLLLLAACGGPAAVPTKGLDSEAVAAIQAIVEEAMTDHAIPGLAIGVVKDGESVYAEGFGVTSLESGKPVTPKTIFPLAETAMTPTAMAIMQLVEAGKIDLDAPISDYLPYFSMNDARFQDITVVDVLTNRSGIANSEHGQMADWASLEPEFDEGSLERWVRSLTGERLLFAPGTSFELSNRAYAILGDVIAKASGQSYEAYMQEHILTPLGMGESTFLLTDVDRDLLASSHILSNDNRLVVSDAIPYHRPFAAGNNLFSSCEDMARFAQASLSEGQFEGNRILSKASYDQMWAPHSPAYGDGAIFGKRNPSPLMRDWGYGWFVGEVGGHQAYLAGGQETGFLAGLIVVPAENLAVVAMGNAPVVDAYYALDVATDVLGVLLKQ